MATSKACTERQLLLANTLHDQRGKEDAFMQVPAESVMALLCKTIVSLTPKESRAHGYQYHPTPPILHAYTQLGGLAHASRDYEAAREHYLSAMLVAQAPGNGHDPEGTALAKVLRAARVYTCTHGRRHAHSRSRPRAHTSLNEHPLAPSHALARCVRACVCVTTPPPPLSEALPFHSPFIPQVLSGVAGGLMEFEQFVQDQRN